MIVTLSKISEPSEEISGKVGHPMLRLQNNPNPEFYIIENPLAAPPVKFASRYICDIFNGACWARHGGKEKGYSPKTITP